MKNNFNYFTNNEKKFLLCLLQNGSKNDSQIAKEIKLSKSTVHRIRKNLNKARILTDYIPIVDLDKIGVNTFFVSLFEWTNYKDQRLTNKFFANLEKNPHVIFLANGEGTEGLTSVVFLGFKGLQEYDSYFKLLRKHYGDHMNKFNTLMIPGKNILKQDFTDIVIHTLKGGGN